MIPEAPLEKDESGGLAPAGEGWFVLNAREARWKDGVFGAYTGFEGEERFPELGFNIAVLAAGQPACYYHAEGDQEDFLVLSGEATLLIEGQERKLRAWDFVHCPAWTEHVFVGGPCVLLAVGARGRHGVRYPRSELALRYGAGAERDIEGDGQAYADVPDDQPSPYREGWLP